MSLENMEEGWENARNYTEMHLNADTLLLR